MAVDLYDRLAEYREVLDDAIAADLDSGRSAKQPRTHRVAVAASIAVIIAGGVGALVWVNSDRASAPSDAAQRDIRETTIDGSIAAAVPQATTDPGRVPSTPAPPASQVAPPSATIDRLALGDSVMVGAAPLLAESGFTVDALESRTFHDALALAESLRDEQRLGDVVVIHLGVNGPIDADDVPRLMETLADVPRVLLLTVELDGDWVTANNTLIRDAASTYPNVSLLDWAGLNDSCPGNCFYEDGIHLRPDGQRYYADLIAAGIDQG